MTHGRLEQHLTYGKHSFWQAKSVFLLDRAQINYAERLEEGGRGQSLLTMTAPTNVDATSVLEGWATRDSKNTGHRFNVKTNTCLEDKFNYGEKTGVKANPNNASQEIGQLKDQNGKRVFTVEEFLRSQQISSLFF